MKNNDLNSKAKPSENNIETKTDFEKQATCWHKAAAQNAKKSYEFIMIIFLFVFIISPEEQQK